VDFLAIHYTTSSELRFVEMIAYDTFLYHQFLVQLQALMEHKPISHHCKTCLKSLNYLTTGRVTTE